MVDSSLLGGLPLGKIGAKVGILGTKVGYLVHARQTLPLEGDE